MDDYIIPAKVWSWICEHQSDIAMYIEDLVSLSDDTSF